MLRAACQADISWFEFFYLALRVYAQTSILLWPDLCSLEGSFSHPVVTVSDLCRVRHTLVSQHSPISKEEKRAIEAA